MNGKLLPKMLNSLRLLFTLVIDDDIEYTWLCPYCFADNSYMLLPVKNEAVCVSEFGEEIQRAQTSEETIQTYCHFCRRPVTLSYSLEDKHMLVATKDIQEAIKDVAEEERCCNIMECKDIRFRYKELEDPGTKVVTNLVRCSCKPTEHACIFTKQERHALLLKGADKKRNWLTGDLRIKFRNFHEMGTFLSKLIRSISECKLSYALGDFPSTLAPYMFNDASWELSFDFSKGVVYINLVSISITEETPDHIYCKNIVSIWKKFIASLVDKAKTY